MEQTLYFAVGFLLGLLSAVAATPMLSRRALRLAIARAKIVAQHVEKHVAASNDAVVAARSVEMVRLKHNLANAEDDSMRLRAMVGRLLIQNSALEAEVNERERVIFDIGLELKKGVARCRDLEVAVATSDCLLYQVFAQRDRALHNEKASKARLDEMQAETNRDRARVAILIAQAENLTQLLKNAAEDKQRAETAIADLRNSIAIQNPPTQDL